MVQPPTHQSHSYAHHPGPTTPTTHTSFNRVPHRGRTDTTTRYHTPLDTSHPHAFTTTPRTPYPTDTTRTIPNPSHLARTASPIHNQRGHVTASKRATTRVTPFHYATTTTNVTSQHPMPVPTLPYPPMWQQSTESCDYIETRTTRPSHDYAYHHGLSYPPDTFQTTGT